MLEGYTTLGHLAAHTSTIRLGLLVTGVTYRHPGLLAKIVATLDVLSGGGGEKKTLRLVARYADACNLFTSSPQKVAHKLKVLRDHCDDVGRDCTTIRKTVLYMDSGGTLDGFAEAMAEYAALGIDEAIVAPSDGAPARWSEHRAAPAAKALARLG
jgi:alkanesulfonate monooxygenase SsuD/methylene tetrahydromethanopterin reductase-like flavin-dependent oxidoreductase (luciferase family)